MGAILKVDGGATLSMSPVCLRTQYAIMFVRKFHFKL